jgi:hypothetical protein
MVVTPALQCSMAAFSRSLLPGRNKSRFKTFSRKEMRVMSVAANEQNAL